VGFSGSKNIADSGLFDPQWYLDRNPDVAEVGIEPLSHYMKHGWKERRNPSPLFDVAYYLDENPDVADAGIEPFSHFLCHGHLENRNPHPHFNIRWYRETANIEGTRQNPLQHYFDVGRSIGLETNPNRLRPVKPIVVMVCDVFPRHDAASGAVDQHSFAKVFLSLGYEVHYLAVDELRKPETPITRNYREALESVGVRCLTKGDCATADDYLVRYEREIAIVFISFRGVSAGLLDAAKKLCPDAKIIFNTVDLEFIRVGRQGQLANDKKILREAERIKISETGLASRAHATIVVSEYEREVLRSLGLAGVFLIPILREFENLDTPAFSARRNIGFVGGYKHAPNVDAVEYFLSDVWPALHRKRPDIELLLAGADMPEKLSSRRDPNVKFIGYVADLNSFFAEIKVTVAPVRFGAGAKGKVVASLGQGVPCVASPVAAEGMGLQNGREISVASTPNEYVARICELYDQEELWTERSRNGLSLIRREYSVARGIELMRDLLEKIGAPPAKLVQRKDAVPRHDEVNGGRDRD